MGWMVVTAYRSGRFEMVDVDDSEHVTNGFACLAEIRAFTICCPACGTRHEVRARDVRPRVFDREQQRFRCPRCRFTARLRVVVDGPVADAPGPSAGAGH